MNLLRLLLLAGLFVSLSARSALAQEDVSSAFFSAYQEYQRAERLEREGRNQDAIAKFRYVAAQLGQIKSKNPDWQPLVVDFRLRKTQEAIVRLEGALDSPTLGPPPDLAVVQDEDVLPPVRPPRRDNGHAGPTISISPGQQESVPPVSPGGAAMAVPVADSQQTEVLRRQLSAEKQRAADLEREIQRGEAELLSVSMELEKTKVAVVDLTTQLRQFKEGGAPPPVSSDEIARLTAAADELQESLSAVTADKEQLEARAQEGAKQIEDLTAKLAAAEDAAKETAAKAETDAKAEVEAARAEAETAKAEAEAAKAETEAAKAGVKASESQVAEVKAALEAAKAEAEKLKPALVNAERESSQKEVQAARADIKNLTQNLAELERERAELIASRDVAQRRFVESGSAGDKSAELIEANRQLEAKLSAAAKELAALERDTTVKDLTQRVAELEKERAELLASREAAEQQFAEAKATVERNAELIEANRQLEAKLSAAADEQKTGEENAETAKELTQRVAELEKERAELLASREVAQQELAEAKSTVEKNREANRELEDKLAAATAQAAAADNSGKIQELTDRVAGLEKERDELLASRDAAQQEVAEARSALEKNQEANRELEDKLAAATAQAAAADNSGKIQELTDRVAGLEKERDELIASREAVQQELSEARSALDKNAELIEANRQLEEKLAAASERIAGLESDAAAKAEVVAGLQKDLDGMKTELADAQTKLKDDKQRFDKLQAINDQLLKEYDRVTGALAAVQLGDVTAAEAQLLQQENEVLRGIIMRQIKEQARREQVYRLAQEELERLEIRSGTLSEKISELAQPTLELTAAEQEMLKRPVVTLLDADAAKMTAQIEVLKPQVDSADGGEQTQASQGGEEHAGETAQDPASPDEPPPSEAAAAAVSLSTELSQEMQALIAGARDEFVRGNFSRAEELYLKFVEENPDNVVALANLGVAQFRQGKLTAAQLALERAVKADPQDAFSLTTLGAVMIEQGRIEDAVQYLERSDAAVPDDAITLNYLGVASSQMGQFGKAEQSLRRAITVKPDYAEAHFNLAVIYATAKPPSIALAKRHYEKALELGAAPDARLAAMLQDDSKVTTEQEQQNPDWQQQTKAER